MTRSAAAPTNSTRSRADVLAARRYVATDADKTYERQAQQLRAKTADENRHADWDDR